MRSLLGVLALVLALGAAGCGGCDNHSGGEVDGSDSSGLCGGVACPADQVCRYDACVPSREGEILSGDPQYKVIPGGRYAALAFEGVGSQIGAAWDSLLRDWLPESGLQLDSRPFFEHYSADGKYDPKTGAFSCDICVPVTAL